MIDDHSRLAHAVAAADARVQPTADERSTTPHLARERGIHAERVLTDNGNGYRSYAFAERLEAPDSSTCEHDPRRPQTNGKARR